MQLRVARLCLDCDELHDELHCPVCASEAFAYLTRWVPVPERRMRPRETTSHDAEVFKGLLNPPPPVAQAPMVTRLPWKRGLVGLTMLGVAGWLWKTGRPPSPPPPRNGNGGGLGGVSGS